MRRTPTTCPHRVLSADGVPTCNIVALTMPYVACTSLPEGACEACCDSFEPTVADLNSVVASLVVQAAEQTMVTTKSERVRSLASTTLEDAKRQLPTLLPHEDDCANDTTPLIQHEISIDQLNRVVPANFAAGGVLDDWAVGVTTSPRRQPTLDATIRSIQECGWNQIELFADGVIDTRTLPSGIRLHQFDGPSGAWSAWRRSLTQLVEFHPDADAYLIAQDDALFPLTQSLRPYLSRVLWPNLGRCIISLYSSADYTQENSGWSELREPWKLGAVAWLFPSSVAKELLIEIEKGSLESAHETAAIDTRIGAWAFENEIPFWFPTPSLVQHIGQISSVWESSRAVGLRRADRFILDELD